ncbi:phage head closure protein [Bacillus licheniformis]|uniref:phage head closure protein n=1 Tax=Bacillus licheniformis TaxID=1402 RepID=UPI0013889D91|nr:phage head closure protein [Bacillus licheniformis]MED0689955.1 phage head closure protein [Bacillus licheniformis]MED0713587.1 phage head closure protein [Bacillus licheniformis]MED0789296.1 phage head closure protein [Bacillus licheniformis]TWM10455.1 hypothetical protein CHCC15091_0952 [Bacillus licheniformis]WIW99378.1 phage head closure protein [Bacillus licheniformis]
MKSFDIQEKKQIDDGIGGFTEDWTTFAKVQGYLDLVTGTDETTLQNAVTEQSTHMLIIPEFTDGITDDMRVVEENGRYYLITYADDPVGLGHHNEIYCKYGGVIQHA